MYYQKFRTLPKISFEIFIQFLVRDNLDNMKARGAMYNLGVAERILFNDERGYTQDDIAKLFYGHKIYTC